jgi:hypothetical protein
VSLDLRLYLSIAPPVEKRRKRHIPAMPDNRANFCALSMQVILPVFLIHLLRMTQEKYARNKCQEFAFSERRG